MKAPVLALAAALALLPPQYARTVALDDVRAAIERTIAASGADIAVAWRPLDLDSPRPSPGSEILINPTRRYHAASTMKVPILIEVYRRAAEGSLNLDDAVPITNHFRSIVDGSPYTLSPDEDSDADVYAAAGRTLSYRALCEAMITKSSNLAANILIDRLGALDVRVTANTLGGGGMQVLRGVEDQKAYDAGLNNTTDAWSFAILLWKIGRLEAVSRGASLEMIQILKRQAFNGGIPAGVPAGIAVAHKTGWITRIRHDGGIVYAPRPYVLVVLVRGLENPATADALIADISRVVWPLGSSPSYH